MRWTPKPRPNIDEWNDWFAWRPVWVGRVRVWLEPLRRRRIPESTAWAEDDYYEYSERVETP